MHLKTVFPDNSHRWLPAKWLHDRPEFLDFAHKCWNAETNETREIFNAGSRVMSSMYRVLLNSPISGERYANCVFTYSTETKSHAS